MIERLRLGCSDLNSHLFDRGLANCQSCSCGNKREDPLQFFLQCAKYDRFRVNMYYFQNNISLNAILNGDDSVPWHENETDKICLCFSNLFSPFCITLYWDYNPHIFIIDNR